MHRQKCLKTRRRFPKANWQARGSDACADFPELAELAPHGLAIHTQDAIKLTPEGLGRADALGPWLYSAEVQRRMAEYEII